MDVLTFHGALEWLGIARCGMYKGKPEGPRVMDVIVPYIDNWQAKALKDPSSPAPAAPSDASGQDDSLHNLRWPMFPSVHPGRDEIWLSVKHLSASPPYHGVTNHTKEK